MTGKVQKLLVALKGGAEALYRERLRGIYLYGSYARGEQTNHSDIDVLIVLDRIDSYGAEIDRTSQLIASLSLESGTSISRVFATEESWLGAQSVFLSTVRQEAVAAQKQSAR